MPTSGAGVCNFLLYVGSCGGKFGSHGSVVIVLSVVVVWAWCS